MLRPLRCPAYGIKKFLALPRRMQKLYSINYIQIFYTWPAWSAGKSLRNQYTICIIEWNVLEILKWEGSVGGEGGASRIFQTFSEKCVCVCGGGYSYLPGIYIHTTLLCKTKCFLNSNIKDAFFQCFWTNLCNYKSTCVFGDILDYFKYFTALK